MTSKTKIFLTLINIAILFLVIIVMYRLCLDDYGTVITGDAWTAKRYGSKYVVSIKNNSDIKDALSDFVKKENIRVGSVTGIASVNSVTLRFYDRELKRYVDRTYNGQMEISSIIGNISSDDVRPSIHLHATCGRNGYPAIAGHFLTARSSGSTELWIEDVPTAKIFRKYDEETGLHLFDF